MSNARILIVEDEGIIAADIEDRLRRLGYKIIGWASTGPEALNYTVTSKPDLILMDIMLKDSVDGIETAGQIRQKFDIPIIYLTAYADEAILDRAKITEPFAYLLKPFSERELRANIEMTLYKHKMDQERTHLIIELQEAWEKVKILSGLIPICSHCNKIRDHDGTWHKLEVYIRNHSEAEFSHGVCPECIQIHYPDMLDGS